MSEVIELTSANFDSVVLKSEKPYLVDFWAVWCGPCRAVAPVVDAIAAENSEKLNVGKVNVDDNQEIAQRYNVMSIPTIILFKDGEVATVSVGAVPKEELLSRISSYL
ncbi:MAG: thioredoxin [Coriobacteriales bacterium]|jgi:thioredoxin 1|nr:thioredoxin [Coriobacteriales bacterium]